MKILIADCGATKADWMTSDGTRLNTPGFNLAHTPEAAISTILDSVVDQLGPGFDAVHFYAAGLVGESPVNLGRWFPDATIEYASDMLGAARAVCGREAGIAAIVGTGANTCQYDGERIVRKVPSGGFILGDEGSAAVLGRLFLTDYLKGFVPEGMARDFAGRFPADYPTLVHNVYAAPAPARYLGGFAPFILSYYAKEAYAQDLVDRNFRGFFTRAVRQYDALPLGIVGGFGYACREILQNLGAQYGVRFSKFLKTPMEGLVQYHAL